MCVLFLNGFSEPEWLFYSARHSYQKTSKLGVRISKACYPCSFIKKSEKEEKTAAQVKKRTFLSSKSESATMWYTFKSSLLRAVHLECYQFWICSQLALRKLQRKFFGASNYAKEKQLTHSKMDGIRNRRKYFSFVNLKLKILTSVLLAANSWKRTKSHFFLTGFINDFLKHDIHFGFPFYTHCIKFGIKRICRISTIQGCSFDCHFVNITQ